MTDCERTLLLAVANVLQREVALRTHREGSSVKQIDSDAIKMLQEGIAGLNLEAKARQEKGTEK